MIVLTREDLPGERTESFWRGRVEKGERGGGDGPSVCAIRTVAAGSDGTLYSSMSEGEESAEAGKDEDVDGLAVEAESNGPSRSVSSRF